MTVQPDVPKPTLVADETTWRLMRRLARDFVSPHVGRIAAAVVCMVIVAGTTALLALLMKPIINDVFLARDEARLYQIAAAVLATFVAKALAGYGEAVLMSHVGRRIIADLQTRLYGHLIHADVAQFHATSTGALISRLTSDVQLMRGAVSNVLVGMGRDALTLVCLVGAMFWQDWKLAAIAFLAFPLAMIPITKMGRRMRRVSRSSQAEIARFTTLLSQSFQSIRHVKAYGMEAHEAARASALIERLFRLVQRAARVRAAVPPIMELLGGIAIVGVIVYGGHAVIAGTQTPGDFFAFITALLLAYEPMKRLANLNTMLQEGLAATQRVFETLDTPALIRERPGARPLVVSGGEIRFDDVRFSYGAAGPPALNGIALFVPAGGTVALVGPSGSGKSTILNLILRFYEPSAGSITIDGTDLRDVTFASLRSAIALVSQEVSLFDDTVRANIAYGRLGAADDEIVAAARAAAADAFIRALPQGYDTIVGEHGIKLSGGQRQRLAIARAMLRNAPILLLDEATSSLDTESERKVQGALQTLMRGRTTLVIAHRLSTVVDADVIYVLEGGRITESGTHRELMARGGAYARLYALQFADDRGAPERRARA